MLELAQAINAFPFKNEESFVASPSQVFVITAGQLQLTIEKAVELALLKSQYSQETLQQRIVDLDVANQALSRELERFWEYNETERAYDRQRIKTLEGDSEPQPAQRDRGEVLRALLAANGGKMLETEARTKMRLDKATFSRLLKTLKGQVEAKQYHRDKRKKLLILKRD